MPSSEDPELEGDAFISYAHLDNVELKPGEPGWITNLHRALSVRLAQLAGKESRVWRDPKLQGNDYFADTLVERLRRVASLIAVISPRYVRSEWTRRELETFCRAASEQGGLRIGDKSRVFKVLKTPVPLDEHPPELQDFLGYEFFKFDPDTGNVREFSEVFGEEAERDFWLKLDDLAHDICKLLAMMEADPAIGGSWGRRGCSVFLALTTADLKEQREVIQRDLEQHGYTVRPTRVIHGTRGEIENAIREELSRSVMSIHMVGRNYSLVPEGGVESLLEIQNTLAIERAARPPFDRLTWIPPGLTVDDERQRKFLEQLRLDPRCTVGTDLLETPLEDMRTVVAARLDAFSRAAARPKKQPAARAQQLYAIYDSRDSAAVGPWVDLLFKAFDVIQPVFEGDEAEIRSYHEENLRECDGVLIFYGSPTEAWLRRKLRELQKSAGYGRTKPAPVVGVCLIAPRTPEKERFRPPDAIVVPQWEGLAADLLEPFIARLKASPAAQQGNGSSPD